MVNLPLLEMPEVDFGEAEQEMQRYREAGTARALAMDNRGPIRFTDEGALHPDILAAYWKYGFYVFESLLGSDELAELERDLADLLDRAPATKDADVDRHGQPAFTAGQTSRALNWVKPLADPLGGTSAYHGRHPAKMMEPDLPEGAPEHVIQLIYAPLMHSDAFLRLYGHPQLLAATEAINGPDFTPFNEAIWVKHPRLGGSVAWHQDGWTHWDAPDLDGGTHGFNIMAQLYGCDAANGVWIVPGSHDKGRVDIKAMVEAAGSDRLPEAVPMICGPGDVVFSNRQAVHGSFANTSPNVRVTLNLGFHRRKSVLNVESGGIHNDITVYDEDYVRNRSRMIMYAIDARHQRYPGEAPYRYQPLADEADRYRWSEAARPEIWEYNRQDIGI